MVNSRLSAMTFDPDRRAASVELRASVNAIAVDLEDRELSLGLRQRRRRDVDRAKFRLAVEAIVSNLMFLRIAGVNGHLAVPRSSGVMWGTGRYASSAYGKPFLDALEVMAHPDVGYLRDVSRGYRFASGERAQSTVAATPRFFGEVPQPHEGSKAISRVPPREVLVLKGRKVDGRADLIDYRETRATRKLRREVERINEFLKAAPIIFLGLAAGGVIDDDHQPIDPNRITVRRIFNNGSWIAGGRLFDGFWESMRKDDRFRYLRIGTKDHPEGEPIVNVDYRQLYLSLAYIMGHKPIPEGDLYDVMGSGSARDGLKRLVNALLFAEGPIKRWPRGVSAEFPPGTKLRTTVEAIKHRHPAIIHLFEAGIGPRLMFWESTILIEVLSTLFARGITALPLHDSVLVAQSEAPVAREVMDRVLQQYSGMELRGRVSVEKGPGTRPF